MNKIIKLLALIIVCEGVGFLGTIFTLPSISTWYATLQKAPFNPPPWVFGPVWTTLYFLMAVSLFLILQKKLKKQRNFLMILFSVQLFLNFFWSIIFFGMHLPLAALLEIIFLWISIALLIIDFWKFSRPAAILLIPYLCWVSLASVLNLFVVFLNP
ncbi:MAG TPA: TspO/MBR family protein [Patescibacteria group bacterium]|nr:TspO/MBR family protein [Patescibacteria group bacterium]